MVAAKPKKLTARKVAIVLDVTEPTLSYWRGKKTGPRFVEIDGRFFYPIKDLRAFLNSQIEEKKMDRTKAETRLAQMMD